MLDEEERRADVDGEEPVEIRDRRLLDRRGFRDAGIGDEDVEAVADDVADLAARLWAPSGAARSAAMLSARPPAFLISATTDSASAAPRP